MRKKYNKPCAQVKVFDDVVTLGDDTMWYSFPGDDFFEEEYIESGEDTLL